MPAMKHPDRAIYSLEIYFGVMVSNHNFAHGHPRSSRSIREEFYKSISPWRHEVLRLFWPIVPRLFAFLTTLNLAALCATAIMGYAAVGHMIPPSILVKRLDPAMFVPSRFFRARALGAALIAMAAVFTAAMFGAWVDAHQSSPAFHQIAALAAIFVNFIAALIEARCIQGNGQLIDGILAAITRQTAPAGDS